MTPLVIAKVSYGNCAPLSPRSPLSPVASLVASFLSAMFLIVKINTLLGISCTAFGSNVGYAGTGTGIVYLLPFFDAISCWAGADGCLLNSFKSTLTFKLVGYNLSTFTALLKSILPS